MMTRKHPHARDLLRRHRADPFIFRQTSPITVCGEAISDRRTGVSAGRPKAQPHGLDRGSWRDILVWSRDIRRGGRFTCPIP